MAVWIIAYDEEQMTVTYQTFFDTVAGTISFENEALFLKDEEGYKLVWDDSMIFRNLTSTDKVRVSTTQAERGEILDRNGRVLAGKGTASSVGIVPGKLENREEAIAQIAELLEITPEAIEKKLSAKWVKDDSFVPIKTIPRVEEIELMSISPDEEVLTDTSRCLNVQHRIHFFIFLFGDMIHVLHQKFFRCPPGIFFCFQHSCHTYRRNYRSHSYNSNRNP